MATDLTKIINYNDPDFQKKYSNGVSIYNAKEDKRWYYDPNAKTLTPYDLDSRYHDPYIDKGVEQIEYSPTSGLTANVGTQTVKSQFQFIHPTTKEYQIALANNFGMGKVFTADQYTGRTMGVTTGGVTLYELKDGTATSTPPPAGALIGGGVVPGYENISIAGQGATQQSLPISSETAKYFGMTGAEVASVKQATAITPTMGTKILDEADLQARRQQLAAAGIPQTEWSKYISAPDAQGRLYWSQPATLYSQTGEKKIVASGSSEASQLMKQGWTLQPQKFSGDAITSNSLRPEAEIKLDTVEKNNYPVVSENSTIASSKITSNTIADYVSKYFPETPTEKEYGTMSDEISKLIGEISDKESYYQQQLKEQEKTTGINVKQTEQNLININNEIKIKTAAMEARVAEIQATPMTLLRQTGAEAATRRVAQADIMFLQSEANAYMNNITFAKQIAQEAVDVKYNPILEQLNIKIQQLKLLEGKMGKEEEKYSNALQLYLADQKQQVADQKELETSIQNVKLQAINDGITDPGVLAQISNAKTVDGALQIYGINKPIEQIEDKYQFVNGTENQPSGYFNKKTGLFTTFDNINIPGKENQSAYLQQTSQRAIQSIDELLPQINNNTTGWGAFFMNKLPTTQARTFSAQLDTLKSNIAFGALTAMREASKTGGALGQVSDREGKLLESTLGALDQLQSADQLKTQLLKIKESIQRWSSAMGASNNTNMSEFIF